MTLILYRKTKPFVDASKEVGLKVNVEKNKYMLLSHHQNAGQNYGIKIANRSFENVAQMKYLQVTNQNLFQEEVKRKLNSGNACYHSVQNLLSYLLLSKSEEVKIYKTIILLVVLYGCETWSLSLRVEHRLRVSESGVLRRICGQRRDEAIGRWKLCDESFVSCTLPKHN
jgi:hypothetical protein